MLDGDPCGWPAGDGGKVTSMHGPASDEPRRPYVPMALGFFLSRTFPRSICGHDDEGMDLARRLRFCAWPQSMWLVRRGWCVHDRRRRPRCVIRSARARVVVRGVNARSRRAAAPAGGSGRGRLALAVRGDFANNLISDRPAGGRRGEMENLGQTKLTVPVRLLWVN
jgi:hypothetical protein